eukprot:9081421-Alexandrium_andersonii.AAC.1
MAALVRLGARSAVAAAAPLPAAGCGTPAPQLLQSCLLPASGSPPSTLSPHTASSAWTHCRHRDRCT